MLRDDFIGLVSFSLSLSLFPFITYLRQQNDKSRYASYPRSRAVSVIVVFAEALQHTGERKTIVISWERGDIVAFIDVEQLPAFEEIAKHIKCALLRRECKSSTIYIYFSNIFLRFYIYLFLERTRPRRVDV